MSTEKKFVTLKTNDGVEFVVEESVAVLSETIKNMVEDGCASQTIPVANVDGKTMAKVLEYCKKHVEERDAKVLEEFDKELVNLDQESLYDVLMAANFLNVKGLLERLVQQVADMIKGKTPEQIRQTFNIANDFLPEEEEEIRRQNAWAFESS